MLSNACARLSYGVLVMTVSAPVSVSSCPRQAYRTDASRDFVARPGGGAVGTTSKPAVTDAPGCTTAKSLLAGWTDHPSGTSSRTRARSTRLEPWFVNVTFTGVGLPAWNAPLVTVTVVAGGSACGTPACTR